MRRSRSRSRSLSFSSDGDRRDRRPMRPRPGPRMTSNFSTQAGPAPEQQQMSTTEILNQYKQNNPANSNIISQNKSERQLYIGNIPQNVNTNNLMIMLNQTLKELGKEAGVSYSYFTLGCRFSKMATRSSAAGSLETATTHLLTFGVQKRRQRRLSFNKCKSKANI